MNDHDLDSYALRANRPDGEALEAAVAALRALGTRGRLPRTPEASGAVAADALDAASRRSIAEVLQAVADAPARATPVVLDPSLLDAVKHDQSLDRLACLIAARDAPTCDALVAASARLRFEDAFASWRLAELAAVVAQEAVTSEFRNNPSPKSLWQRYARSEAKQRLAITYVELGAARRAVSDLAGADIAFQVAERAFEEGTGHPIDGSRYFERLALLRWDQGKPKEALSLARKVWRVAKEINDPHEQGTALVLIATLQYELHQIGSAITSLNEAATLIDPARNPRALLAVHFELVVYLLESAPQDASLRMPELRRLAAEIGTKDDRLKTLWLEGRVAMATNRAWAAIEHFARVQEALALQDRAIDLGLVTLDLAGARFEQGDLAAARDLALEAERILQAAGLHLEAMAARLVTASTAELQAQLAETLRQLAHRARAHGAGSSLRH